MSPSMHETWECQRYQDAEWFRVDDFPTEDAARGAVLMAMTDYPEIQYPVAPIWRVVKVMVAKEDA